MANEIVLRLLHYIAYSRTVSGWVCMCLAANAHTTHHINAELPFTRHQLMSSETEDWTITMCVLLCIYTRWAWLERQQQQTDRGSAYEREKKSTTHTHTHFPAIRLERSFHHCADETTNNTMLCWAAEYRNLLLHYEMVFAFILFLLRCNPDNWTESKCHVD